MSTYEYKATQTTLQQQTRMNKIADKRMRRWTRRLRAPG